MLLAAALAIACQAQSTGDQELRVAIDGFVRANSYRFEVLGHGLPPFVAEPPLARANEREKRLDADAARADAAEAKTRASPLEVDVKIEGKAQRGRPLFLATGDVEAFRLGERLVFHSRSANDEWRLLPALVAGAAPRPRAATTEIPPDLPLLVDFPTPHDLLGALDPHLTKCARVTGEGRRAGESVWECPLEPDALHRLLHLDFASAPGAPTGGETGGPLSKCTLRIVLVQGRVDELVLDEHPPLGASSGEPRPTAAAPAPSPKPAPLANGRPPADIHYAYKIADVDRVEVVVPDAVQNLLGRPK